MYITSGHWILYSPHTTVTHLLINRHVHRTCVCVCVSVPALSVDEEEDWGLSPECDISSAHHPTREWCNGDPDAAQTDAGHTTAGSSAGVHTHTHTQHQTHLQAEENISHSVLLKRSHQTHTVLDLYSKWCHLLLRHFLIFFFFIVLFSSTVFSAF